MAAAQNASFAVYVVDEGLPCPCTGFWDRLFPLLGGGDVSCPAAVRRKELCQLRLLLLLQEQQEQELLLPLFLLMLLLLLPLLHVLLRLASLGLTGEENPQDAAQGTQSMQGRPERGLLLPVCR